MVASRIAPLAVVLATVVVVLCVAGPQGARACNAPLDPKMEMFLKLNTGNFDVPIGFKNVNGAEKPVYVIDEGQAISFEALWNCGAQSSIQISDSQSTDLSGLMVNAGIAWWNSPNFRGYLLPLTYTQYASFMISLSQGIPMMESAFPGEPQWLFQIGNTIGGGIVKDSAFRLQSDANNSYKPEWCGRAIGPVYLTPPAVQPPLSAFNTGNFDANCPADYTIRSNSNELLANPNNDNTLDRMPENGEEFTEGGVTYTVWGGKYVPGACWDFVNYGTQWNVDAGATGYLEDPDDEHPMQPAQDPTRPFVFLTPSDPLMYKVTVEVVFLFWLRGCNYTWKEAIKSEYDWAVQEEQTFGGSWTDPPSTRQCSITVHGVRCSKVTDEAKKGICFVRVRDVTPPKWFLTNGQQAIDPAQFTGTTGDVLSEDPDVDPYFTVTMVDNNPYAPYHLKQGVFSSAFPSTYDPTKLKLRLYYTTELYDHWRGASTDSDDVADDAGGDPLLANLHLFNVFKPKMVWCNAAVADMNVLPSPCQAASPQTEFVMGDAGVVARTYDKSGNELSWPGAISIWNSDPELTTPGAVGAENAAYSTFTWRIPKSAFKEPLPLHLARNSTRWQDGKLRFFPVMCDAAGNWNPHLPGDQGQPPTMTFADPTVAGSAAADIVNAAQPAPEQASALALPASWPQIAAADFAGDPTVAIEFTPSTDDIVTNGPAGSGADMTQYGQYGAFTVDDDEPPETYLFVRDQKYGKTYRFGLHKVGDGLRPAVLTSGGVWPAPTTEAGRIQTRHSFDLCTPAAHLGPLFNHFEPVIVRYDQPPTASYGDFYADPAGQSESFAPSLQVPASAVDGSGLPGLWVDEDTRLVFKVIAADNIDTFEPDGAAAPASLFAEKRYGATLPCNGISRAEWEIVDSPTVTNNGGVANTEPGFEQQAYTFRNPNVDPTTGAITGTCYAHVTVEDAAGPQAGRSPLRREVYVNFFVVSNQHKFRSVEENRRRRF